MKIIFQPFAKYATFSGRATRKEFWLFQLLAFVSFLLVHFFVHAYFEQLAVPVNLDGLPAGPDEGADPIYRLALYVLVLPILTFIVSFLVPSISVTVRRLHDVSRSGWWLFLIFIPILGGFVLIYFLVHRGVEGDNRFGPDPR